MGGPTADAAELLHGPRSDAHSDFAAVLACSGQRACLTRAVTTSLPAARPAFPGRLICRRAGGVDDARGTERAAPPAAARDPGNRARR